jgi:predicted transcriptional regulator
MDASPLKALEVFGLTQYEIRAYAALLEFGNQTGYALANSAQVPRPNIYATLHRLEERGFVSAIRVKHGVEYSALPADEMLARLSGRLQRQVADAEEALRQIRPRVRQEIAWNLQGYEKVMQRARELLDASAQRVLMGTWSAEAVELAEAIARAQSRSVEVSVLCIQGCERECGGCRGKVFRYPLARHAAARWFVLSSDQREILMAQVLPNGTALGIHSKLEVLVSVGSNYLRNAIAVAEIFRSEGPGLAQRLDAGALAALQSAGLAIDERSWLDEVLAAVHPAK